MKAKVIERKVHSLIDKVYHRTNLEMSWRSVRVNGGSGGIDKVTIPAFQAVVEVELKRLHEELKQGTYRPMPVRRIHIPKKGKPGEKRPLGIPAIRDRVCQQALKTGWSQFLSHCSVSVASDTDRDDPHIKPCERFTAKSWMDANG